MATQLDLYNDDKAGSGLDAGGAGTLAHAQTTRTLAAPSADDGKPVGDDDGDAVEAAVAATSKTRGHLAAIERLAVSPDLLVEHGLIGRNARFSVPRAAKAAKVPVSSAYREPIVSRLRALAHVPAPEGADEPPIGSNGSKDKGSLRPAVDPADIKAWLASSSAREAKLTADDVDTALDVLEAWDGELDGTTDGIPSYGKRPAKRAIARTFDLHPHVLEHPAVDTMLLAMARRHGVQSARGGKRHPSDRHAQTLGAVTDRMHSLALRDEAFPADSSGLPLLGKLIDGLGLDPDVAYRHRFRLHAAECQRTLLGPEAVPSGPQLEIALCHAIVDIYQRDVEAGTKIPPLTVNGILRVEALERKLNIVVGTSIRHPEIGERLLAIAERHIAGLRDERTAEREAARIAHIVDRIQQLGDGMAGREKAAINKAGGVSMKALSVALKLQFRENATNPLVEAALAEFVAKVGLKDKPSPSQAPRSQQNKDVDEYCRLILKRGFGPPRQLCSTGASAEGAAADLKVAPESITSNQLERIRNATRAARKLNPEVLQSEPFAYELNSPNRADLLETMLADPMFDDGMPGDPLDGRKLDWNALSTALGVSALYLRQNRIARTLLDAKMLAVGVAPHPGDRSGITFGELRTFGRRRRAEQATRAARADAQAGGTPGAALTDAPPPSVYDQIDLGATIQPASVAARSVRALEAFLRHKGLALSDRVGLVLLKATAGIAIDAPELGRWRLYHAELAAERASHPFDLPFGGADWGWRRMSLGSALALLCRAKGTTKAEIIRVTGAGRLAEGWMNGFAVPRWPDEEALERLNGHFDLEPGTLTDMLNGDRRPLGSPSGERTRRTAVSCHLPFRYASMDGEVRRQALKRAQGRAVQSTKFANRHRVLIRDEYIFRYERWPKRLQAEWTLFLTRRRAKGKRPEGSLDIYDTITEEFEKAANPVATPTTLRERETFERFFGFLMLATERHGVSLLHQKTRADELEFHEENIRAVGYQPRGGLGLASKLLTMGAAAIPGLVRAFVAFSKHRSDGYSRGTISEVKNIVLAVKIGSPLRSSTPVEAARKRLVAWLRLNRPGGCPGYERETVGFKEASWDEAAAIHTAIYLNLFKFRAESRGPHRDKVPEELRVDQKRISFDPVMVVLASDTPAAIYRMVIQGMIRNQPMTAIERHTHLRDCLIALILFQTYLRIKNIAQLTYNDQQTGQLRRVGKTWFVRIHRSRFKNAGGAYFKHGHYFNMRLRDEDGLYAMIEAYLKISRPYLRSLKPMPRRTVKPAVGETAGETEARGGRLELAPDDERSRPLADEGPEAADGEDDQVLTAADDEDGDNFEDADGDGEPDEARFFVKPGGGQYLPSQMAARYKHITIRYMSESPERDRGLKGLMGHGPHAVRHVGATDALARDGSWEAAARVIQDSIRAVQECYVLFTPDRQGKLAGASMERGRMAKPKLPEGVFMLNHPARVREALAA